MLASDIISAARGTLIDATAPYRWTDADMLLWLNAGLQELWKRRPDAFYITTIVVTAPAAMAIISSTVPVLDQFQQALTDYLLFRCFSRDSDDQANVSRSEIHMKLFIAEIT